MIRLGDRKWREFKISEVFVVSGTVTTHPSKLIPNGDTPRITCAATNNGLENFYSNKPTEKGNVLTVDSATDGCVNYQIKDFIATDHVEKLTFAHSHSHKFNKHIALFIKQCIDTGIDGKYGYGYKFSQTRIKKQYIMLPATANGQPDWQFMEDFMRQKEQQILKPTIEKLCKQLISNEIGGGLNLLSIKWKEFCFTDIFTEIQRGKRLKKADHTEGNTPYVSSTSQNNGVDGFVGNESGVRAFSDCLTLANSGSVGSAFYHRYEFVASDHVTKLKRDGLDKYAYLFLIPLINRLSEKYSFNREINDERIKREKLLLPVDAQGNPDFAFMSSFMQEVERDILATTLKYFHNKQNTNTITPPSKNQLTYKDFLLRNLFHLLEPGKSKGLNHLQRKERGISYLGATNLNNGVLDFVEPVPSMVQRGNCIAFIRNGEGSMGYAVYKAEDFIATSDMTIGYNAHLNKYTGTYITTIADRIRGKYNFGYKRNAQRLAKEIITLPTTPDGTPDWEYMEAYMRQIESRQILAYLSHIAHRA